MKDKELDEAIEEAIAKANSELAAEGHDMYLAQGRCPNCGCPDIDIGFGVKMPGFIVKCWDCATEYGPQL